MNDTVSRLMEANLLGVFNQRDGKRRAAAIRSTYAPDVRWTDDEGVSVGREALEAKAQELQQQSQGLVFTKASPVYQTLDFGYLAWHLGPAGGDPVASGFDVAIVRNDVIAELYTVITEQRSTRVLEKAHESTTSGGENTLVTHSDEYRSLYLSYLKYCNEHDFDRMASFYTSTIKVNDVPMDPAAVAAQFAPLISAFPDWHWEIRNLVVDGKYIAVHFAVSGTHRGAFRGVEATGRRVTISEFTLYRVEDGKFAEVWDHTDMDAVMRQIGRGDAPATAPADEAGTADSWRIGPIGIRRVTGKLTYA